MALIPLYFAQSGNNGKTEFGFFVKYGTQPPATTALLDVSAGASGYFRVSMTTDVSLLCEAAYLSTTTSLPLPGPVSLLNPGTWYWVSGFWGSGYGGNAICIRARVFGAGITAGDQTNYGTSGTSHASLNCDLGWGVPISSSYDDFPNAAGWEMASLYLKTYGPTANADDTTCPAPPTSDLSPSGLSCLYLCHQTIGAQPTIIDSTANHYDLTAGPKNAAIVGDGPY